MTSTTLTTKQVNFVKEIELMAKRDNNDIATTLRLYKTESLVKMARAYKIKLGKSRARDNIYPVTYVNKKQQITIDFEATEKLINETQFDN